METVDFNIAESTKQNRRQNFRPSLRLLLVFLVFAIYFAAAQPFMRLMGQWPAPYWLSVSLGVFLIFASIGTNVKRLPWIFFLSLLGFFVAWFFDLGIYRLPFSKWLLNNAKWYFQNSWPATIPVVIFMASIVYFANKEKLRFATSLFFAEILFLAVIAGNFLSAFHLPVDGACGIDGFNYEAYGFRLGVNLLVAVVTSFGITKMLTYLAAKTLHKS